MTLKKIQGVVTPPPLGQRRVKARPHCLQVALDLVECNKIDIPATCRKQRSTKLPVCSHWIKTLNVLAIKNHSLRRIERS